LIRHQLNILSRNRRNFQIVRIIDQIATDEFSITKILKIDKFCMCLLVENFLQKILQEFLFGHRLGYRSQLDFLEILGVILQN